MGYNSHSCCKYKYLILYFKIKLHKNRLFQNNLMANVKIF